MELVFTLEDLPKKINKSIFLAGGTSRHGGNDSWRKEALKYLEEQGFDGVVFIPEARNWLKFNPEYEEQIKWEDLCLNAADCILFWIPRDLEKLPCFTTNDEWGYWKSSGKVVLGAPENAEKVNYQKYYANDYNVPFSTSLEETVKNAISFIGEGAERQGGERLVPLFIWKTPSFQQWYKAQTHAGNRLDSAKLLFNFRPKNKQFVFMWILHVSMFIESENRYKTNEFVLARSNISSALLYYPSDNFKDTKVVLIREFRSPASTNDGFIRELPSGSEVLDRDPLLVASEEVEQETGFHLSPERFNFIKDRQLSGTLSSHRSFLYSVQLTEEELMWFEENLNKPNGNEEDSEKTYVEVKTVGELLDSNDLDWSNLGMLLSII